jgi:hypothetical protein
MGFLALLLVLVFIGSIVLLFRKGQRRKGALGAFVSFSLLGFVASAILDSDAREAGFADYNDQLAAKEAGFPNAADWSQHQAAASASAAPAPVESLPAATEAPAEIAVTPPPAPPQPTPEELAAKEKDKAFGLWCLSTWDGSHPEFVKAVKAQLNDPDSFEHDDTLVWTVRPDGRNQIVMAFRAKNGFGGTMRYKAAGTFDNKTCGAVQIDLME